MAQPSSRLVFPHQNMLKPPLPQAITSHKVPITFIQTGGTIDKVGKQMDGWMDIDRTMKAQSLSYVCYGLSLSV